MHIYIFNVISTNIMYYTVHSFSRDASTATWYTSAKYSIYSLPPATCHSSSTTSFSVRLRTANQEIDLPSHQYSPLRYSIN